MLGKGRNSRPLMATDSFQSSQQKIKQVLRKRVVQSQQKECELVSTREEEKKESGMKGEREREREKRR